MLSTYRDVLRIPGAARFSIAGFIARAPISIIGLGIIVYIAGVTGSYAEAGILAAAFQVPAALFALATSRWVDRFGQHRLLPPLAAVHGAALVVFVVTVQLGLPFLLQALAIALAGASQPAIGAVVRARWVYVVGRDGSAGQLRGAFALESIVDELIFTIGPLLVTALALRVALPAPLILAAVLVVVGSVLLAAMRASEPPPNPGHHDGPRRPVIREPGMPVAFTAALGLGAVFGAYEVTVVAFAEGTGSPAASGVVLALWAAGSAVGGLWFGARHWRMRLPKQAMVCLGILAVVLIPAPFVRSIPVLAAVTFVGGAAVAPALISAFSLTERLVPSSRLTEGLTWATSGLALGFSAGSAIAGAVIDGAGTTMAFVIPILGAGAAAAVVGLSLHRLDNAVHAPDPSALPVNAGSDPIPGPAPGAVADDAP